MGAVPSALLVALAAPPDLPVSWARDLAAGLAAECARAGASVIGGDTARASSVLLAVTGLGDLAGVAPVLRSGAAPGDVVAVAGPLGHAAAGLALLSAGLRDHPPPAGTPDQPPPARPRDQPPPAGTRDQSPAAAHPPPAAHPLVAAHLRPEPPYDAGPEAAGLGATAMIDISDGLLADLAHVADASGVRLDLDSARLRPGDPLLAAANAVQAARRDAVLLARTDGGSPPAPPDSVQDEAPSLEAPSSEAPSSEAPSSEAPSSEALRWVLTGGEDHSLAATFPPGVALPARWTVIGQVRPGRGVLVDGRPWSGPPGWDHFR
jgi:thiamine-monophosphate kinase